MRKLGLLFIAVLSFTISRAQYTVISDDSAYVPTSANALLEVYSQNGNKGILVPRLTTAQRTALVTVAPADNSLLVYDTDTKTFWYFDGTVWIEIVPGGTDDQYLTLSNDTLYIENGNNIYLGGYNQTLSFDDITNQLTILNGNTVIIPDSVNDADSDPTNEIELPATAVSGQVLTWDGTNWIAQNPGSGADNWGSQTVASDATLNGDGTSANPLTVNGVLTDDQNILGSGLSGTTLTIGIENGTGETVDLSSLQDGTGTDDQNIQGSGLLGTILTIGIENGTSETVDLSSLQDGTGTDNQQLSLSGNTLLLTNSTSVDLSGFLDNTDNQTLSLSGTTLSISGGNSVDLNASLGNDWKLTGNAGTTAGTNFLGTTDAVDLVFKTNATEWMRILSGGNVGIGTATPSYKLDVNGYLRVNSTSNPGRDYKIECGSRQQIYAANDLVEYVNGNKDVIVGVSGGANDDFYICSVLESTKFFTAEGTNQRIGIGTTAPTAQLHTTGTVRFANYLSGANGAILRTNTTGDLSITDFTGSASDVLLGTGSFGTANTSATAWQLTGNAGLTAGTNFLGTTDAVDLVFKTNATEWMRILSSGNVGIGTTTPGYPLTVTSATAAATGAFFNTQASVDNIGVYGECAITDYYGYGGYFEGGYMGVRGIVAATGTGSYFGVYGSVSGGTGNNYGVYGTSDGDDGFGVDAYNSNASGTGLIATGNGATGSYLTTGTGIAGTGIDGIYGKASSTTGTGIIGAGNNGTVTTLINGSGIAGTGNTIGVAGFSTVAGDGVWGGYFEASGNAQYAYVAGQASGVNYKINGTGSVSTIVKRPNGSRANMFCPEAPEILFQDYGVGKLINGKAHINVDPIFANNIIVNNDHPLKVFVQLEGDCKGVYVTNKSANGFDVIELQNGNSNVSFSWTIVANRADEYDNNGNRISKNANVRFPDGPGPIPTKTIKTKKAKQVTENTKKKKPNN